MINGIFDLLLVDNKGMQIKQLDQIHVFNGYSTPIELQGVQSGVYYLKLKNKAFEFSGTLLIK
jgi:hypothetical protein